MTRKALFFDIDGTLLTDGTKILPKSAEEAVKKAREAGHMVFINTGRSRILMQELEGRIEVDGYLCGCGTLIEVQGRKLMHHVISAERRFEIQKGILQHKLDGILEGPNGIFVQPGQSHMPGVQKVKDRFLGSGVMFEADWTKGPIMFDKFCVLQDENSDMDGFKKFLEPDFDWIDRGHNLFECGPKGFDKATAMEFILHYFDIPWEESYAFGDSSNDLAMIKYACHSVIMEEHAEVLEPYAELITKKVEEDGIAYAFQVLNIVDR